MNQLSSSPIHSAGFITGHFPWPKENLPVFGSLLSLLPKLVFSPIPPDVLLIPLCLGKMKKAFRFALICSIASVLGGLAGYAIGAFAWDTLANWFYDFIQGFTPEKFDRIRIWYEEWGWPLYFWRDFLHSL